MKNKAVFLDRDGTINVEKDYLYKTEDFEFVPGIISDLLQLQSAGFLLIIITNQSGIARGYYTEKEYYELDRWMKNALLEEGVLIAKSYYCPHLPNAIVAKYRVVCKCRKPNLSLYEKAINSFNLDLSRSFAVGDKIRDCAICQATMCRGFLIGENESTEVIKKVRNGLYHNVQYAQSFHEAVQMIINR